jgi:hypothetical protein
LIILMGKRRQDANFRRFFDEFTKLRISRLRATGVVDPVKRYALIPVGEKTKLLRTAHTHFRRTGGGFSYFVCPRCAKLAAVIYLVTDEPRCRRCCAAIGIVDRSAYGFGRTERLRARDQYLDALIRKVETKEPLMFKPAPDNWVGRCRQVYRSQRLTMRMRRALVTLRLSQLASQQASEGSEPGDKIKTYKPSEAARQLIDIRKIWRARTPESLERALDNAQVEILLALQSDDLPTRLIAAKLMLRTLQGRALGFT